jgi:hypothetical protein
VILKSFLQKTDLREKVKTISGLELAQPIMAWHDPCNTDQAGPERAQQASTAQSVP